MLTTGKQERGVLPDCPWVAAAYATQHEFTSLSLKNWKHNGIPEPM